MSHRSLLSAVLVPLLSLGACSNDAGVHVDSPADTTQAQDDAGIDPTDAALNIDADTTSAREQDAASPDESTGRCPEPASLGVRLIGRYDGCDTRGPRMSWSGTGFVARFSGTGLRVTFGGGQVQYTVVVDGAVVDELQTDSGDNTYELVTGLDEGEHTVEVYRQGEASFGFSVLQAVEAIDGDLLSAPDAAPRKLEVVGDSISAGYGIEGDVPDCPFSADTENHWLTYGSLLARRFDSELSTVAWSGKGVVSNYGGSRTSTMPALYPRAVAGDKDSIWDFTLYQPDAVILNLGTNDYSADTDPEDAEFVATYEALLTDIRSRYSDAVILCTIGPMLSGSDLDTALANIRAAVANRQAAGDTHVRVIELDIDNDAPGCDWHPNIETHTKMADALAVPLVEELGW